MAEQPTLTSVTSHERQLKSNTPQSGVPVVKTSTQPPSSLAEEALADDDLPDWAKPEKPATNGTNNPASKRQEPKPGYSTDEELIEKIESLFESHPEDFTRKHRDWILNNARKAPDRSGLLKMVAYTEKVIRSAKSA